MYCGNQLVFGEEDDPDFVDLGLPSGTQWMTHNLGAVKKTDYGLYFQWGDTVGYSGDKAKIHSYWSTCPGNGGASDYDKTALATWDAANVTNGVLNTNVDAAYVFTHGQAKMPTLEQYQELIENTTSEWTTIDDINGWMFTSKSDSSKYVFFPASGYYYEGRYVSTGNGGYYWNNWLGTPGDSEANYLGFSEGSCARFFTKRHCALSVRAVLA